MREKSIIFYNNNRILQEPYKFVNSTELLNGLNVPSTRFYSALYKKLLDPQLATSSHQGLFLNLVFKALKKDHDIHRVMVFFKRLLQVSWTNWQLCTIKSSLLLWGWHILNTKMRKTFSGENFTL